jgi:hypothetical protein
MHGDNSWVSEAPPGITMRNDTITHVTFSLELLVPWLNFLLDNQFLRFDERLFRQIHGIPMGTNCAVFLANLYLFTYELDFIIFLSDSGDISTLKRLQHLGRYVDDLLALDADILRNRLYLDSPNRGIYPRDTLLLEETGSGTTIHYMDLTISRDTRLGLIIDIYDKRSEPGFRRINVIRFPHISSYISDSAKFNIITSQFVRFARLCTTRSAFILRITNLLAALFIKGYPQQVLLSKVRKLIFRNPDMYAIRSPLAFFNHIRELTFRTLRENPPSF